MGRKFSPARHVLGFSLLELSLVLVALGVLGLLAHFAFSGMDEARKRRQGEAEIAVARAALRTFLLNNNRLPCPDTASPPTGGENCGVGDEVGHLPYVTLGMTVMAHNRMLYGVYRAASPNDITVAAERTGDSPDNIDKNDAIAALRVIPDTLPNTLHVHVAGRNSGGAFECSAGHYAAFVLVVPWSDKNNDGSLADGLNFSAVTSKCFASPAQRAAHDYDDVVSVEPPSALIGWLSRQ